MRGLDIYCSKEVYELINTIDRVEKRKRKPKHTQNKTAYSRKGKNNWRNSYEY